jgi:hypothetical protein
MYKSFLVALKDWFLFRFEESPAVAFAKSSEDRAYRNMLFGMAGNTPVPSEVWASMPQMLKGLRGNI